MTEYTIKVAVSNPSGLSVDEISRTIQNGYTAGNIAGMFSIEMIGTYVAIITFIRDEGEDLAAVNARAFTAYDVMDQLYREFREAWNAEELDGHHVVRQIVRALETREGTVQGLLYQQPRLRLVFDLVFKTPAQRDRAIERLRPAHAANCLGEIVDFDQMLDVLILPDPSPLQKAPDPEPTRVVLDLTGGTMQWVMADKPARLVVVNNDEAEALSPEEVCIPVPLNQQGRPRWIKDAGGEIVAAHYPLGVDLDAVAVERFYEQLENPKNV